MIFYKIKKFPRKKYNIYLESLISISNHASFLHEDKNKMYIIFGMFRKYIELSLVWEKKEKDYAWEIVSFLTC